MVSPGIEVVFPGYWILTSLVKYVNDYGYDYDLYDDVRIWKEL